MKRKWCALLALVLTLCLFVTACGDDTKSKKEELEEIREEIDELEEELDELKSQEATLESEINEVEVPRFIGMMYYTEIEGVAEYQENFDLKIMWEDANNSDCKIGEVFKQIPAAGKKIKKGATVTLYVNNDTPDEIFLDVRAEINGVHKDKVRTLLQEAGFEVKEDFRSSEEVPADHVIQIDIEKGKSYPRGTVVTMTVSTGVSVRPTINFPNIIIGQNMEKVKEILKNYGFEGTISYVKMNYTDEQYAEKGTVMGVMIDNVLLEELPEQIAPDASLTLVLSSGLKDVVVELEWPKDTHGANVNVALNICVVVNGTPNDALSEKYNNPSCNPSYTTDKMTFTFTNHPGEAAYDVGVNVKKAVDSTYTEYVRIRIDPVTGTWTVVDDYQPLPGIDD